jgi:periplasmic copper chaperone A
MMMRRLFLIASALALLAQAPASAHVVLSTPEARPNAYYVGEFRLSHGCGESPTVAFRIEIPDGINIARPQPKPGWAIEIERAPLPAPVRTEYGEITDRVSAVTWRGLLPTDQFDQFALLMKLPNRPGPIYFRALQTCEQGGRAWVEIPASGQDAHDLENPAPVLNVRRPSAPAAAAPAADPHAGHH